MENSLDFLANMFDEVALEGLDGITLTMFWKRLEDRPNFSIVLDDDSKAFLWECIAIHKDIQFYELPEPRDFVPPYNRYNLLDEELGIVIEPTEKIKDPYYPVVPVKDGVIRGSCATYTTRRCVTPIIRNNDNLIISLVETVEKWGDRLVLVASSRTRLLALIGTETNPLIDLTIEAYCLLERIGRSRYLGEVTQGEDGLIALNTSFCKQLHYYRKKLSMKGLITKQIHYLKNKRGTTSNGCLLHLTRFYVERKTKMEFLMKALCDLLKDKPNNRETCSRARQELGIRESTFKKLFYRPFQKWILISNVPYQEFYPNATHKESHTQSGVEKTVKIVQLIKHYEENEEENDEHENDKVSFLPLNVYLDYSKIYCGYPFIQQIFDLIKKAGPEGISSADLGRAMTLPRLDVRNLLRLLVRKNHVVSMLEDRGRQKVTMYIAKMHERDNEEYSIVKEHELSNSGNVSISSKRKAATDENNVPSNKKIKLDDVKDEGVVTEPKADKSSSFQNIVSQVLELQNSEHFSGRAPKVVSVSEKPPQPCVYSSAAPQLTYRKLKRCSMILDYLKDEKFSTIGDLQKVLREREKEEEYTLDKKSTARIVHSLANSKKIKIFKVVLKLDDKRTNLEFICDNSVELNDPGIQAAIEQAKFRYFSVSKEKSNKTLVKENTSVSTVEKENISEQDNSQNKVTFDQTVLSVNVPKFMKARIMHKFLFYLVFEHKAPFNSNEGQHIYDDNITWKRYVPPLPEYPDSRKEGWCFLADIFSRMPLSVFVEVVTIRQPVANLKVLLDDEEKQHYLVKHLPQDIRNALLDNRKYLFSTTEILKNLCYMGLVSFGPQVGITKDQVFLFVHKKAFLKDTSTSRPGYIHVDSDIKYETKYFSFKSLTDVDNFWLELENTSYHTPLGKFQNVVGKTFAITEAAFKPELKKCIENKGFEEVGDHNCIPGDGLGAAGYDSALFLHVKRNWVLSTLLKPVTMVQKEDSKIVAKKFTIQSLLKTKGTVKPEKRSRLQRLTKHSLSLKREKNKLANAKLIINENIRAPKKEKVIYRTVKSRSVRKRVPYYDEIDKACIKKMKKARCEWFPQEDSFLLLCKVASLFLDAINSKNLVVPFTIVRDLLHEHFPEMSDNKSSRACQRRIRYMMLNPTTVSNVAVFLGEAKQDDELVQEFSFKKPPKSHLETWGDLFKKVLEKLIKKFTLPAADRCKIITLPSSIEEFNKKFELTYSRDILLAEQIHKEPKNISDIKFFVLCSLILSVMALSNDNTRWKFMLLQLYKSYPQSFLQSVIANLRRKKIIALKKSCNKNEVRRANSPSPYKFSIIYENTLLTKFPLKLFQEAQNLLKRFSSINPEAGLELKGDIPSGYAATVLSMAASEQLFIHAEIPEHIILFDSSLSQEARSSIVERIIHTLNDSESIELSKILNNETSAFNNKNKSVESSEKSKENINLAEDQISDDDSSNVNTQTARSSNASRYALYLLRQEKSQPPIERSLHSQDYIVLNSCRLFCRLKENTNTVLPINPPEIIEQVPDLQKNLTSDFITKDKLVLCSDQISEIRKLVTEYIPKEALFKNESYLDELEILYQNYSPQTILDAKYIFHRIYQTEVKGIAEKAIWEEFQDLLGELTWFEHLLMLREAYLIIRVGILRFTYVCIPFTKDWLLESCLWSDPLPREKCDICTSENKKDVAVKGQKCNHELSISYFDSCEKVFFIPRTWRNPDGTLNKSAFFDLLNTILGHIISSPSASVNDVCERFSLVMQPVQTLELIEVLEKARCIYRYYCKSIKPATLFSKPQTIRITEKPDPSCIDHLETFPDAICKIEQLKNAI